MRILHLDDDLERTKRVHALLASEWPECRITRVATAAAFVGELRPERFELLLADFSLGMVDEQEALRVARRITPATPFVYLSRIRGEECAIVALQAGAADYVLNDGINRLIPAIRRALEQAVDLRKRQTAEARIQELGACLNQTLEAIVITDLFDKVTFWNQGAERLFGWTGEEALGKSCESLFGPPTRARLAVAHKAAQRTGEWSGDFAFTDRDQQRRLIDLRVTVIRNAAGFPCGQIALACDLAARRQAERRLREQAEMIHRSAEALFVADLGGTIRFWNMGAERLFGWPADEIIGRGVETLFDITGDDARIAHDAVFTNGQWVGELRMAHRDRTSIPVESRQSVIWGDGGLPAARLCISSGITDRRRREEQFFRAQRMENIGLLAAGISHDLNNMLAPILLAAPMLRDHVQDPGALALLGTLERSAERGANLVRQILAFAQGVSGDHVLVQVKHLMRDLASVISGTFPKSIRLEEYIASDLWPIKGNATQIHQVLLNLSVNARDSMPDGGTLRVRAENRMLDEASAREFEGGRAGAFLMLLVEDSGSGIAPEILKQMWEPFFTTKEVGKGTGLGLSTTRGIIKNHQGFIHVRTAIGKGTAFRVFIPAAEGVVTTPLLAAQRDLPPGRGELILVVDDECHIRELTQTVLTRNGYRVVLAADGAEAVMIFAERAAEIRLVITDLHMPNLDGAMLGRALRRLNPATKLLVVSGLSSPTETRPGYRPEEFADAFLHKPFKPDVLLSKVLQILRPAEFAGSTAPWPRKEP